MKILKILSLYIVLISISCTPKQKSNTEENINTLNLKEAQQIDKIYENAGELVSEINFELIATKEQKIDWPEGIIPWISIENPQSEIKQLKDANEIVIKETKITLIIDYPLTNPAYIELSNSKGFTREDLILEISKNYHKIYEEEESTAKTKTIPYEKRTGLINRNQTEGKYGIWGHDMSDLDLSTVEVHKTKEGKTNLILIVES